MRKSTDFHAKKKVLIFVQKWTQMAVIFVSAFSNLLTNRRFRACFKFSLRFADDNICLAQKSLPRRVSLLTDFQTRVVLLLPSIELEVGTAQKIWNTSSLFFYVIFNYRCHSPATYWPTIHSGVNWPFVDCFFFSLFFLSFSLHRPLLTSTLHKSLNHITQGEPS